MSSQRLFAVVGLVDDDLIEEAEAAMFSASPKTQWKKLAGLAACAVLVISLGFAWFATGGLSGFGASAPGGESGAAGGGGAGHDAGTEFMSYAGPVLPLTVEEDATVLAADRSINYAFVKDVQSVDLNSAPMRGMEITDNYTLTNLSSETISYNALYPFTGSLNQLATAEPAVAVNGTLVETQLYAGSYAGGFSGIEPNDNTSYNLDQPNSWTEYQSLLESGDYQTQALAAYPALNQAVTVYEFTDLSAPTQTYPAATQAVSFTIDETATQILSYGFEGASWDDETGWQQYSFFVPDGMQMATTPKLLLVLGEDIGDYTLQGYQDGGCDAGEEINDVSSTVKRSETTLAQALDDLCQAYVRQYDDRSSTADSAAFALFRGAAAQLLTQYGVLSDSSTDRYATGQLEDVLSESLVVDRVMYLAFPVSLAAGESITVTATLHKEPSFDFVCSGAENTGIQGYDLVTAMDTKLAFRSLTASVAATEDVELVRQNFGFDLANGVTEVTLNPAVGHYYLEIRPLS